MITGAFMEKRTVAKKFKKKGTLLWKAWWNTFHHCCRNRASTPLAADCLPCGAAFLLLRV
jgi:hypothetical protein